MKNNVFRFDEKSDLIAYVESDILEEDRIGRTIYRWVFLGRFLRARVYIRRSLRGVLQGD